MNDTVPRYLRQTIAALVAVSIVLSVFGPVGTVAADPSVSVQQSADSTTVSPGDTVTFTTELAVSELNAPQLQSTIPDGWEIESQSADGPVAYNDGTWTWLAGDDDGVDVSYTVEYTVSVPDDADPGDYAVGVEGSALAPGGERTAETDSTTITVEAPDQNQAPSASFDVSPASPDVGEEVSLDASGSSDADGSIVSYEWDFDGDGTVDATGSSPTAAHTYDSADDYTVELTVIDDDGATDTATETITVSQAPQPDPAEFQLSALDVESPVEQGTDAAVTATVENVGGESGTQTVALDVDGSEVDSQSVTIDGDSSQQVSFDVDTSGLSVGDHDVTLSTDDDSASATLTVNEAPPDNQPPSAAFDVSPADPETDETVTFDAAASSDADGSIASYEWDFGDGETATGETATHSYETAGDYTVELTVTDDDGATDTATETVTVAAPSEPGPEQSTAVSLSPDEDLVAVNGSTTFDVVVENADGGVGAYSLGVSVDDASAAAITDLSVDDGALSDVEVAGDGSSASADVALLDTDDTGPVTVATVTVDGEADGTTDLALDVSSLGTESGDAYEVTETNGATLTVSELVVGASDQPAQDLDDDGVYEDVNGDGTVDELDVQLLFAERNGDVVQGSPDAFDFNGDGEFDILDVQSLYYEEVA
ncbi:PKD domain-containing protein [Halobellus rufus]|uniref:PKD domain-containing protein n=1 Tax=Halobellus rufus TaxID=1448860 RepID=UPI000678CBC2|nr:PKD domain-containing protein [Halobellus rufus]